jgi:hypothetical protein
MNEPETWIGSHPRDGRQYDCQCARCGSSVMPEDCDNCGGTGVSSHDCGEDTCCCLDPDDNVTCDWCGGRGHFWVCLSSSDWCRTHAREGRETIASGTPEWFCVEEASQ